MPYFLHVFIYSFLFTIQISFCYSQSSYPQNLYHPINLILPNNDTINKLNKDGLYEGFHIITDNSENKTTEGHYYQKGYFHNGIPVHAWEEHYPGGMRAVGEYMAVTKKNKNYNNRYTENGINKYTGAKTGEWKYYIADSALWKIVLHETIIKGKTITTKEFIKKDSSTYELMYYKKTTQKKRGNIFFYSKEINHNNNYNGYSFSKSTCNFIRNKTTKYRSDKTKQSISRHSRIFNRGVVIKFNNRGKLTSKTVSKHRKRNNEYPINHIE